MLYTISYDTVSVSDQLCCCHFFFFSQKSHLHHFFCSINNDIWYPPLPPYDNANYTWFVTSRLDSVDVTLPSLHCLMLLLHGPPDPVFARGGSIKYLLSMSTTHMRHFAIPHCFQLEYLPWYPLLLPTVTVIITCPMIPLITYISYVILSCLYCFYCHLFIPSLFLSPLRWDPTSFTNS